MFVECASDMQELSVSRVQQGHETAGMFDFF